MLPDHIFGSFWQLKKVTCGLVIIFSSFKLWIMWYLSWSIFTVSKVHATIALTIKSNNCETEQCVQLYSYQINLLHCVWSWLFCNACLYIQYSMFVDLYVSDTVHQEHSFFFNFFYTLTSTWRLVCL